MVEELEKEMFQCPLCSGLYSDEGDAIECLGNCASENWEVNQINKNVYKCEMCGKTSCKFEVVEKCETEHTINNDIKYQHWLHEQDKKLLIKVGNSVNQCKLIKEQGCSE